MYNSILDFAEAHNLIIGICRADDLKPLSERDIMDIPFFEGEIEERISPQKMLKNAKTVIVFGNKNCGKPVIEGLDSIMAASLSGFDYHKVMNGIGRSLSSIIEEAGNYNCKIQVDSGPLIERMFAIKSGIGVIGLNQNVINGKFGTFFNIGLIVTDYEFFDNLYSNYVEKYCSKCGKCIEACPTNAIGQNGEYDYNKCISYLTQKKGVLTENEMSSIGVNIYGCDICQNACPHNEGKYGTISADCKEKNNLFIKILEMGKKEFANTFRHSNFFWRGKTTIQRNCLISLFNLDKEANVEILRKYSKSDSIVLRQTAEKLLKMY